MTVLLGVLLVVALVGIALTVFVIYFHGVFPVFRSIKQDPVFNEQWQNAGARFRLGFVGAFFGAAVGAIAAGLLVVTGHLWQGAVMFVLGMTIALLLSRERFVAARRYRGRKVENSEG